MDFDTTTILKSKRCEVEESIKNVRRLIQYWYVKRDEIDSEIENEIKIFNKLIAKRKGITAEIACYQHCLRKYNDEYDKVVRAIEALEALKDL